MPRLRAIWRAWDQNPLAVYDRRLIYKLMTPLAPIGAVYFLILGARVPAVGMFVLFAIALESGARSPGTRVHRLPRAFDDAPEISGRQTIRGRVTFRNTGPGEPLQSTPMVTGRSRLRNG